MGKGKGDGENLRAKSIFQGLNYKFSNIQYFQTRNKLTMSTLLGKFKKS